MDVKKARENLTEKFGREIIHLKKWTEKIGREISDSKNWTEKIGRICFAPPKLDRRKLNGKFTIQFLPVQIFGAERFRPIFSVQFFELEISRPIFSVHFFQWIIFRPMFSVQFCACFFGALMGQNLRVYYFCPCYGFAWIIC